MARNSDGTTTNRLFASYGPLSGSNGPFTIAFWFKSNNTAQTNRYLLNGSVSGTDNQWSVIYGYAANQIEYFTFGHSGTDPRTSSGITISDTNWHHVAYRKNASGASAWDKFLDGTKTSISASIDFTHSGSIDGLTILNGRNSVGVFTVAADAQMADLGLWDISLGDDQIASLAKGAAPLVVRKGIAYWRLGGEVSPEIELYGANGATSTGTTKTDHPRVIYPKRTRTVFVPDAAGGTFKSAWAIGSNIIIHPAVL